LAVALMAAQKVDQRAAEDKAEHKRGKECSPGAEGDIAEQVEDITTVRKFGQPIQH